MLAPPVAARTAEAEWPVVLGGKMKKEVKAKGCHCGYYTLNQVCSGFM